MKRLGRGSSDADAPDAAAKGLDGEDAADGAVDPAQLQQEQKEQPEQEASDLGVERGDTPDPQAQAQLPKGNRLERNSHKWHKEKHTAGAEEAPYKYGEVLFEETGQKVPYLIVPDNADGKDPKKILENLTTYVYRDDAPLPKPNMMYQVRSRGKSYLEYAEGVYENDTLAKAWGWKLGKGEKTVADVKFKTGEVPKLTRTRSHKMMDAAQAGSGSRAGMCSSGGGESAAAGTEQDGLPALNKKEQETFDEWKERTFGDGSSFQKHQGKEDEVKEDAAIRDEVKEDAAIREYGELMLQCFAEVTKSVVTSDGWYIGPAGRKARQQLIGDTIDKYGEVGAGHKKIEDVTWVQYASLQNEELGGENHEALVKEFKEHAVDIAEHDTRDMIMEKLVSKGHAIYPSEEEHFPCSKDIQGQLKDKEGKNISAKDWLNEMIDNVPPGVQIHPHTTLLILFDQPSHKRGAEQSLPWSVVDELHEALRNQGILEGMLLVHGDITDLKAGADYLASSMPVITFKSTGGASDYLAREFESRQTDPDVMRDLELAWKGGLTMGRPYLEEAMTFKEAFFIKIAKDADDREMMAVDVLNPNVGEKIARQMAEMLTMIDDSDSQLMDFPKQERNRMDDAWDRAFVYRKNAAKEKMEANIFNYLMMLINLVLVLLVVYKTITFPDVVSCVMKAASSAAAASATIKTVPVSVAALNAAARKLDGEDQDEMLAKASIFAVCTTAIVILPILSGMFMTFNNAFAPIQKYKMLRWGADRTESEIYKYRARAGKYSAMNSSSDWNLSGDDAGTKKSSSKQFVSSVTIIGDTVRANSHIQNSSLPSVMGRHTRETKRKSLCGQTREDFRAEQLKQLKGGELVMEEHDDPSIEDPKYRLLETQDITDDGYSLLNAEEYLAVRTKGKLADLQLELPGLARQKKILQYLTYLATVTSVILGTMKMDLYIAVSTGFVSMCTSILEYTKLEARINTLNTAEKDLDDLIFWWSSLNFVERRMAKHKDHLIKKTEDALCAEADMLVNDMSAEMAEDEVDEGNAGEEKKTEGGDKAKQDGAEKKEPKKE